MVGIKIYETFCKICDAPLIVYATEECPKEVLENRLNNAICDKCKRIRKLEAEKIEKQREKIGKEISQLIKEEQQQYDRVDKFYSRLDKIIEWLTIGSILYVLFGRSPSIINLAIIIIIFTTRILIGMFLIDKMIEKQKQIREKYSKEYYILLKELERLKEERVSLYR